MEKSASNDLSLFLFQLFRVEEEEKRRRKKLFWIGFRAREQHAKSLSVKHENEKDPHAERNIREMSGGGVEDGGGSGGGGGGGGKGSRKRSLMVKRVIGGSVGKSGGKFEKGISGEKSEEEIKEQQKPAQALTETHS